MSHHALIADLRHACDAAGGTDAWAKLKGFSPQFLNGVLRGDRDPTERLGNALGYIRKISFCRLVRPDAA